MWLSLSDRDYSIVIVFSCSVSASLSIIVTSRTTLAGVLTILGGTLLLEWIKMAVDTGFSRFVTFLFVTSHYSVLFIIVIISLHLMAGCACCWIGLNSRPKAIS